jgi:hypothetical protein
MQRRGQLAARRCAAVSGAGRWLPDNMGLTGFDCNRGLLACVIQRPRSGIQWETTDADTDIELEAVLASANIDAEYEALVAEHSVVLV